MQFSVEELELGSVFRESFCSILTSFDDGLQNHQASQVLPRHGTLHATGKLSCKTVFFNYISISMGNCVFEFSMHTIKEG